MAWQRMKQDLCENWQAVGNLVGQSLSFQVTIEDGNVGAV